jgi:hypothetical protein
MRKGEAREILGRLPEINNNLAGVLGVTTEFIDGFSTSIYDVFEDIGSHDLPLARIGLRQLASKKAQAQTNPSHMITAIPTSYAEQKKTLTKGFYKSLAASRVIEANREMFTERTESKIAANLIAKLARQSLLVTIDYSDAIFMPEDELTEKQIDAALNLSEFIEKKSYADTYKRLGALAQRKSTLPEGAPVGWSAALGDIFFQKSENSGV